MQKKSESWVKIPIMTVLAIWSIILCAVARNIGRYTFCKPFINAVAWSILFCVLAMGLFVARHYLGKPLLAQVTTTLARAFFWSLIAIHGLVLPLAHQYALSRWPGGDDGPGIGWGLFVGLGTFLSVAVSVVTLISIAVVGLVSVVAQKFKHESFSVLASVLVPFPVAAALAWLAREIEPTFILKLF